ncbi:M14 family zinc carboxypeptidase [Saliphagus infecundisoli]|uniref:M14 family zinc carboxypeptidase n=1 Tax=Saliphagus infecundisoli TaxID=1849069 RepID=A0ABD5QAE8_9EURY|nr:M14 family zinc carboxypeptidase [Saliphagus infecundisoli]
MSEETDTMTHAEAVERIPDRDLPEFWVGDRKGVTDQLAAIDRGRIEELARSPGDRPIHAVTYGESTDRDRRANYNSAVAARDPTRYVDRGERDRPVVFLLGPVHGHEVEGLTGLCNLLSVLETGRDLADNERPTLRILADRCRLVVIPCGNPDGLARFEPRSLAGMTLTDLEFWGQGTRSDNRLTGYPDAKGHHPMTGDEVDFLGCYFDDDGINPMHDEFFDPMGPEAPAILDAVRREAPDVTLSLHSHAYPPGFVRTSYVPLEAQADARAIHRSYNEALYEQDLSAYDPIEVAAESGSPPPYFNLLSAAHHTSGTLPLLHESAHGLADGYSGEIDHEGILEAQFALYEAVLRHALDGTEGGTA